MKFSCSIAEDLLPLYLEDLCSEDSRAALEKHLRECRACREKLARMQKEEPVPTENPGKTGFRAADCAKKIKWHRRRAAMLTAALCIAVICLLTLCSLTLLDMHRQANPTVFFEEAGVYDLTAAALETTATQVDGYLLFTNTQRIQVSIPENVSFDGEILLWDATDRDAPYKIAYGYADQDEKICVFDGLSASRRYRVTCDSEEQAAVVVDDGRIVNFWYSFRNVLSELAGK